MVQLNFNSLQKEIHLVAFGLLVDIHIICLLLLRNFWNSYRVLFPILLPYKQATAFEQFHP